ncbi:MAG: protein-glutamate O-methyltransferase CheR [Clostridiales bacterium]|nr:protein-glutamate O-methyltransferase CheR [Clostridiales bacterium]
MKNITDSEFERIRVYVKENFGISLSSEKKSLIYSRLHNVIRERDFESFTEYFDYLMRDRTGEAVSEFIDKVTTNHTYFMREADHFDYFRETVLPYIVQKYKGTKELRLWCAGCSSGEESYTLQMIINDYFRLKSETWSTNQMATDISSQILSKAKEGVYEEQKLNVLPKHWLKEYFVKDSPGNLRVSDTIKSQINYQKYNLMDPKVPFYRLMQIIFCRNVMIYFDPATRERLVSKFYNSTEPGGYLFIGHSESLNHINTQYKYIKPAVYRKE